MGSSTSGEATRAGAPGVAWAALCSGAFGLGVGRALYDSFPLVFYSRLPALLAGLAAGALVAALALSWRRSPSGAERQATLLPLLLPALSLLCATTDPLRDWILILGGLGGFAAAAARRAGRIPAGVMQAAYPLSLAAIVGALYLRTVAPTVGQADTFEFQVNAIRLGISHGSGYPLYILLGNLFSLLPVGGTAAFRINLSAAAFGVAASLMVYALARSLRAARPAAWIGALSLAASRAMWSRAVEAEVYTLHVALVGLILVVTLRSLGAGFRSSRLAYVLAFAFGLALTNHLTAGLLAPAVAVAIASAGLGPRRAGETPASLEPSAPRRRLRIAAGCALWFALGLSLYLYLPLRWPAVNQGEYMSWEVFWRFATGQEAQGALRLNAWYADLGRYGVVGRKVLDQFGWPGALAALVGLTALARRQPTAALVTVAAYAAFAFFGLSFYVPDPDYSSFLLPAHFVQAVWMAVGVHWLAAAAGERAQGSGGLGRAAEAIRSATFTAFFLLPASLIWTNFPLVDRSADWEKYRLGHYILGQPLEQGAAILADSELIAPLYYLQVAEGLRRDLDIVVLPTEDHYRAELAARIAAGQTVYLGRYLPHLADAFYLRSVGPLTEVALSAGSLPASLTTVEQDFGGVVRLRGFRLDSAALADDRPLRITLYWQALEPPPGNYRVVLRLVDGAGLPALTGPAEVPVGQMYPTAAWPLEDVVSDFHSLALDASLVPGAYTLQVGLFPPFSPEGLLAPSGQPWLSLATVDVQAPASPPGLARVRQRRIRFGDNLWLMGFDVPGSAVPGQPIPVTLYWMRPPGLSPSTTADLCLGTSPAAPCANRAQVTVAPDLLPAGRPFETRAQIAAPDQPGRARLWIQVGSESADCGWLPLGSQGPGCELTSIAIEGAPLGAGVVNFDNQIVLQAMTLETPTTRPGGTVVVSARWRGLRPMVVDYTVFVHLLGPDGLVHGQVDTWPVQGTLPTSQWPRQPNAVIADRFEIRVPDDAPPGRYAVEAGWYLLATLERLPVVDASGVAIDDRFLMEGPTITH